MPYTEKGTVEDFIVQELQSIGWRYLTSNQANSLRDENLQQPLLTTTLKNFLKRLNSELNLTDTDINFVIDSLKLIPPNIEGIRKFLDIFKNGLVIPLSGKKKRVVVKLVDHDNPRNNDFLLTRQFTLEGLTSSIRADILLFLNGIPLVLIECKSPTREEVSWLDAYRQIKRYEETVPELFKYVQFSIATDGITTRYFPNSFAPESEERTSLSEWKDPYPFEPSEFKNEYLKITIHGMLHPQNLLDLIENFTFIRIREDRLSKVMARYQQFRASNKIFQRVVATLLGRDNKKFGLIWHWQGSGKTYTMAFSAWKLFHCPQTERPSIFVMVDRKDLQEQILKDFAFIGVPIERIPSIKKLIETLQWGGEGKRGIFLVTVEKFSPREFEEIERAGFELEIKRENVIILADEVHRTQYGKFRTLWSHIFKNAFVFGFTGTPLSKPERNTFQKFCPPDELYLDRYSMAESLGDGFTVPLSYQARLPEYHLRLEELEAFASFEEGVIEQLSPEELKALRKRVRVIKAFAKKPERVERIAKDIAEHFNEIVKPTSLKAMVVAIDREACVLYKNALDELLPPEESEIVMTFNPNDKSPLRDYLLHLQSKYSTSEIKYIHDRIIYDFKVKENPKILIVTDMLITGFDAPNLWAMYLDKPLREHRLLQAIARTNRPYLTKRFGLINDYIGVLNELQRALEKFEASDARTFRVVLRDLTEEKREFERLLSKLLKIFEGIKMEDTRESLEKALDRLMDPNTAKDFEEKMKELMRYYEMLGGEAFLKPYLRANDWLLRIFIAYNKKYKRAPIDELKIEEISRKTIRRIQEMVDVKEIEGRYPALEIGEELLRKLGAMARDEPSGVIDIISSLSRGIKVLVDEHPSSLRLASLREEIEAVYEALRFRRIAVEEAYEKIKKISEEVIGWKDEEEEIGKERHPIYEAIKQVLPQLEREEILKFVDSLLATLRERKLLFNGWHLQRAVVKDVRKETRILLLKWLISKGYGSDIIDTLQEAIFEALKEVV